MPVNDLSGALIRERIAARRRVKELARRIIRNELRLSRDPAAVAKLIKLEWDLELAARDLVNLVDDSPEPTWPKGWKITLDVKP